MRNSLREKAKLSFMFETISETLYSKSPSFKNQEADILE